jgi:hypothetical protein
VAPLAGAWIAALVFEYLLFEPTRPAVEEPRAMKR